MRQDLLRKAITLANERIRTFTSEQLKECVFDRLVDDIYDELLKQETRCIGGACNE